MTLTTDQPERPQAEKDWAEKMTDLATSFPSIVWSGYSFQVINNERKPHTPQHTIAQKIAAFAMILLLPITFLIRLCSASHAQARKFSLQIPKPINTLPVVDEKAQKWKNEVKTIVSELDVLLSGFNEALKIAKQQAKSDPKYGLLKELLQGPPTNDECEKVAEKMNVFFCHLREKIEPIIKE